MSSPAPEQPSQTPDPRAVFLVHGRNHDARDAVIQFLRSAALQPITWDKAKAQLNKPAAHVTEILDFGLSRARAVLVLFTGDDMARLSSRYGEEALTPQARPNVLFEAGMAWGRAHNRTVFAQIGPIRGFSNLDGVDAVLLDGTPARDRELLQQLRSAGCTPDMETAEFGRIQPRLFVPEPGRTEVRRSRLAALTAALLATGLGLGWGGHHFMDHTRPKIQLTGAVRGPKTPVTLYFSVHEMTQQTAGKIEAHIPQPAPGLDYRVLYALGNQLVDGRPLKVNASVADLGDVVVKEEFVDMTVPQVQQKISPTKVLSDDEAEKFINKQRQ